MEFGILGPLRVSSGDGAVVLEHRRSAACSRCC